MTKKLMVLTLGLVLGAGTSTTAFANNIVCGDGCTVSVTFGDGQPISVPVIVNEDGTGTVSNTPVPGPDGSSVTFNNLTLNPDPGIIFGIGAVNGSNSTQAFSIAFSTPIALDGSIDAASTISYTLTDGFPILQLGDAGVTLTPFNGSNVLVANDLISPSTVINKGVDVGPSCSTPLCGPFTANNTFSGGPFDTMGATVSFFLTRHDAASLSGGVSQTPVPEPTTLLLMSASLLGLAGLAAWQRKQRGRAF